ncbi:MULTISPECIES: NUDIX hydrolase [Desulfococcus]|jgi:ADP-ribose pyrophosphatase|uniref:NUDIX hydrolase n=1 Tax=Desulfococcus multivorans DSM 2059 TaxID=1121405 RepID=S7VDU0_DESML|nr:NUDIX hydrolase [Desulfococcus multivorans]AOY59067.1 hydrolase, NUDIX family [Desulfococcus multivorans]AQV01316.1 NUDIX hydrolase [Desulfococcus multivorans]EPR44879.1 NUDIX hydrolase [Desulfococcus multivorans DSM 2059]MDX9817994.1 NUDIX hydrolase [Desulfococcus multivorans]SJZ82469.1 ADP-ribose pyrophosphatase YjhB, NUDIX family [Desulfococcus multivorans DSM 2059]
MYPDQPRVGVGAVVFKNDKILLVLRGKPPAEGVWAIPGGRLNLGETLKEAAEREIREETGIDIRAGEPVFTFDVIERDPDGGIRFHYVIVDLAAEYVGGVPSAGDDAVEVRWVSAAEMDAMDVNPTTRKLLKTRFSFG